MTLRTYSRTDLIDPLPGLHFIDGKWTRSGDGRTFETIDPSTEAVLASVARGGVRDIDAAVRAAHRAQYGDWRNLSPAERGRLIFKLSDVIEADAERLALLETLDVGKPVKESLGDIRGVCATLRYNAGAADKMEGATIPLGRDVVDFTVLEPVGVTAHIVPWNYPLGMVARSVAPALAAGCTVVIKPAEQSPLTALAFAELCQRAGFPDGVVNVVAGFGEDAGAALVSHPLVRGITFTGSVETGRKIYSGAAQGLKPVVLELGVNNPMIVMDDEDLE
jgi:acyl-CoA reductase-like NAD-dependent aldehyde dehydrogenase